MKILHDILGVVLFAGPPFLVIHLVGYFFRRYLRHQARSAASVPVPVSSRPSAPISIREFYLDELTPRRAAEARVNAPGGEA